MAMFAGAHISINGRPFSALDEGVVISVPEPSPDDIRLGVLAIDVEAPLDSRIGQILARMDQERALRRRALRCERLG